MYEMFFLNNFNKKFFKIITRIHSFITRHKTRDKKKHFNSELLILQDINLLMDTPTIIPQCSSTEKLHEYNVDVVKVSVIKCDGKLIYVVDEPKLPSHLKEIVLYSIEKYLEEYSINPLYEQNDILNYLMTVIENYKDIKDVDTQQYNLLVYYLQKLLSGYGPLYPLLNDDYVEDITYEGSNTPVAIYHKLFSEYRWIDTNIVLSNDYATKIALILSYKVGQPLSITNPYAEGLTYDGHRVSLTLGNELTLRGTTIVIRRRPSHILTIVDLIKNNMLSLEQAAYLMYLIEHQLSILIVGGVASGKTTLLRALLMLIPHNAKIITIEDTPELQLPHTHWDPLVVRRPRHANTDILNEIEMLTRMALRRRGDYLVIGETRGKEARLLVQASTLGYGSLTTFHANSVEAAITRLTSPPISLKRESLTTAFNVVILLGKTYLPGKGYIRRVFGIFELTTNNIIEIFRWRRENDIHIPTNITEVCSKSLRLRELAEITNKRIDDIIEDLLLRREFIHELIERNIQDPADIVDMVTKFYNNIYTRGNTSP